jgi:hypothetical protein
MRPLHLKLPLTPFAVPLPPLRSGLIAGPRFRNISSKNEG